MDRPLNPGSQRSQRCAHFHGCLLYGFARMRNAPIRGGSGYGLHEGPDRLRAPQPEVVLPCRAGAVHRGFASRATPWRLSTCTRSSSTRCSACATWPPTCTRTCRRTSSKRWTSRQRARQRPRGPAGASSPPAGCATRRPADREVHPRARPEGRPRAVAEGGRRRRAGLHRAGLLAALPGHPQGLVRACLRLRQRLRPDVARVGRGTPAAAFR